MSLKAMVYVLEESDATLGARLVLLALAERAGDCGEDAYPSVETIAGKARLSKRAVQYALRKLEAEGDIEDTGTTEYGTTNWRVVGLCRGCKSCAPGGADSASGGAQSATGNVSQIAPKPSSKPKTSKEVSSNASGVDKLSEGREDVDRLCSRFAELVVANGVPVSKVKPDSKGWRREARLLLDEEGDGRDLETVLAVAEWCQADSFWSSNVLSIPKLRKQYDALRLRRDKELGKRPATSSAGGQKMVYVEGVGEVDEHTAANLRGQAA
jgi:hypothetical protein